MLPLERSEDRIDVAAAGPAAIGWTGLAPMPLAARGDARRRGAGPDQTDVLTDVVGAVVTRTIEPTSEAQRLAEKIDRLTEAIATGLARDAATSPDLAVRLRKAMVPTDPPASVIPTINDPRNTRVRAILCSPERQFRARYQAVFVDGDELFTYYMRQCFCPQRPRLECATTYDFTSWGSRLEPIVRFIKQRGPDATSTIDDLYQHLQL